MRNAWLVLLMMLGSSLSQVCNPINNTTIACPRFTQTTLKAQFVDDIVCMSSFKALCSGDCAGKMDLGCWSFIKTTESKAVQICKTLYEVGVGEKFECKNTYIPKESILLANINPNLINYDHCKQELGNSTLIVTCPPPAGTVSLNVSMFENESVLVISMAYPVFPFYLWVIALILGILALYAIAKERERLKRKKIQRKIRGGK